MTTTSAVRSASSLVLALALAACAGQGGDAAAPPSSAGPLPTGLVLQVAHTGGFTTPEVQATRLPLVSVYGDGRILTEGPQIAIWPAPALT